MTMYLTRSSQYDDNLILTRDKPYLFVFHYEKDGLYYEIEAYRSNHSIVFIRSDKFKDITFDKGPVEVELIRTDTNPLVYLQRHKNSDGSVDLYIGNGLSGEIDYVNNDKRWWEFWKPKFIGQHYFKCNGIPYGTRLPRKWFPEIKLEDGYVGFTIKLKEDDSTRID